MADKVINTVHIFKIFVYRLVENVPLSANNYRLKEVLPMTRTQIQNDHKDLYSLESCRFNEYVKRDAARRLNHVYVSFFSHHFRMNVLNIISIESYYL